METNNINGYKRNNNRFGIKADIFLILSKLFFVLFLLYYGWFQMVFFHISSMTFLLGSVMIYFIVMHFLINKTPILRSVTSELIVWSLFALTSFCFGMVVAVNTSYVFNSVITFAENLVMIFGMVYISTQDKKIDFILNSYILFSLVCAIHTVFWGVYVTSNRISMSAATNPNTLGISMVIGIFCVLYKINFNKILPTLLSFSEVFLFLYVIVLSGSRKSFIGAAILFVIWFVFVRKEISKTVNKHGVKNTLLLLLVIIVGGYIFSSFLTDSPILVRLQQLFKSGDEGRVNMYIEAFKMFEKSPIVGIGMNNYRVFFGTYSHSTYAEVLACTGIVGAVLYFIPYMMLINKTWVLSKSNDINVAKNAKNIGGLLLVLLFLGTGVIHFYEMDSSIAFGFIIAFCRLYYNKKGIIFTRYTG